ncbi:MAG: hypothetical protein M1405_01710 [Patescibacteria group bacterium]|nr:hypothetical protein [Patescibacteria group bacterium]
MEEKVKQISDLLQEASEIHHSVYKIINGNDSDWASWYSDWLINLSKLPEFLGVKPVRSELTYVLVLLDKEYTKEKPEDKWEDYYAKKLIEYFSK